MKTKVVQHQVLQVPSFCLTFFTRPLPKSVIFYPFPNDGGSSRILDFLGLVSSSSTQAPWSIWTASSTVGLGRLSGAGHTTTENIRPVIRLLQGIGG